MTSRFIALPVLLCALFAPVGAQQVPSMRLKPASATHPADFSGIARIRELADGRVAALDSTERKLYLVDFQAGRAVQLGRVGDGPEEYRRPIGLFALPGDSTMIFDAQTRRLVILHRERPVATVSASAPVMINTEGFILGAGPGGALFRAFPPTGLGRAVDQGDSLFLVRVSRSRSGVDTLARMRSGFGGPPGSATKATPEAVFEDQPTMQRQYMMAPGIGDQATSFPDGWVAVARMDPYRVDWITPSGQIQRGPPLNVPLTILNDREKRFYLSRLAAIDGKPAGKPEDIKDWKASIPPFWGFYNASLYPTAQGHVLIARAPTTALPTPTYDWVDRTGAYRGQLILAAAERVVGFGPRSIYVVSVDDDGLEQLRRHPWP
jgi:hypothetical protein